MIRYDVMSMIKMMCKVQRLIVQRSHQSAKIGGVIMDPGFTGNGKFNYYVNLASCNELETIYPYRVLQVGCPDGKIAS